MPNDNQTTSGSDAPTCSVIRCDTLLCGTPSLWVRFRPGSAKTPGDMLGRKCAICYERNQMQYHYPESGWEMILQNDQAEAPL